MNFLYAYRTGAFMDESVNAVIAPGPMPNNRDTPSNIDNFLVVHVHAHEGALRKTAKQLGVTFEGHMHECKGYSLAKEIIMSVPSKTDNRAYRSPRWKGRETKADGTER